MATNSNAPKDLVGDTTSPECSVSAKFLAWLVKERLRWVLWCPVLMACGIAVYFQWDHEPSIWLAPSLLIILGSCWLLVTRKRLGRLILLLFFIPIVGFSAAQVRTLSVHAPVIEKKVGPVWVVGTVLRWEPKAGHYRVTLSNLSIDRLSNWGSPASVRITVKSGRTLVKAGDKIRVRAVLYPPAGPAMPGAFNFARQAYFKQIGGVGYAVSNPEILERRAESDLRTYVVSIRQMLTERILLSLPGVNGSISAALITGERGNIPENILSAMRESGLAHLLAISGLHIGLVAGILFLVVRFGLASIEFLALKYPIKKWAAVIALIGSFFYLLISGMTLPTQRAFLMLGLVLAAVILDRRAISMHLVAWAGCVILFIAPESLFNVSFQMSFAAVIALVAVYEGISGTFGARNGARTTLGRISLYFAGVLITTVVAGLATAPFALFHFNQVALYSILANILAVPITGFWIMPFAILSVVSMPFGLESYPLMAMGIGIEGVVGVAQFVQNIPDAIYTQSAMNGWLLVAITFGGLWLCLWQQSVRYLGLIPIVIAMFLMPGLPIPDMYISSTGNQIAIRQANGELVFVKGRRGIVGDTWLRRTGNKFQEPIRYRNISGQGNIRCDSLGCVFRKNGNSGALLWHPAAISEDCLKADVVVSTIPIARRNCSTADNVIDRFDLWRNGNHVVYLYPDRVIINSNGGSGKLRPWSRFPREYKSNRKSRP